MRAPEGATPGMYTVEESEGGGALPVLFQVDQELRLHVIQGYHWFRLWVKMVREGHGDTDMLSFRLRQISPEVALWMMHAGLEGLHHVRSTDSERSSAS